LHSKQFRNRLIPLGDLLGDPSWVKGCLLQPARAVIMSAKRKQGAANSDEEKIRAAAGDEAVMKILNLKRDGVYTNDVYRRLYLGEGMPALDTPYDDWNSSVIGGVLTSGGIDFWSTPQADKGKLQRRVKNALGFLGKKFVFKRTVRTPSAVVLVRAVVWWRSSCANGAPISTTTCSSNVGVLLHAALCTATPSFLIDRKKCCCVRHAAALATVMAPSTRGRLVLLRTRHAGRAWARRRRVFQPRHWPSKRPTRPGP
jgi:hypothetical protein